MPRCPRCNEDVDREDTFCGSCGTDLRTRGARPGDVILVVDRGLVLFGKFSLALLGLFLVFGAFVFGFDLRDLVDEMRDRRAELAEVRDEVAAATDETEQSVERLKVNVAEAKQNIETRLADAETQVTDLKAKVAEAESALSHIRSARERVEIAVASIVDLTGNEILAIQARAVADTSIPDSPRSQKLFALGQSITYAFFEAPSDDARRVIDGALAEWQKHANLVFRPVDDPNQAIIRVGFREGEGSWAYVGRDALTAPPDSPTINFGWDITQVGQQNTVLSEFGHVLGFPNEHQNPNNGIEWDEDAVLHFFSGPPNFWSKDQVYQNILRKSLPEDYPCSRDFDPNSIMMDTFPRGLTEDGGAISPNPGLSDSDKACAREMYPY